MFHPAPVASPVKTPLPSPRLVPVVFLFFSGKGGQTIQELQQRFGARVQVERDTGIVKVSGDPAAVDNAVRWYWEWPAAS